MNILSSSRAAFLILPLAAAVGTASIYRADISNPEHGPQDVISLDHRISLLEQRFYAIDARINRLEQTAFSQRSTAPPQLSSRELEVFRNQITPLERRLAEIDCAVVKLDERTLAPAVREARTSTEGSTVDSCRRHAESPIRLSTHP